jgi:hypothetical protein
MSDEYEDWHVKLFEAEEPEHIGAFGRKGFSLKRATMDQREAIEFMAAQEGRMPEQYWQFLRAAHLTYYDIIKIASPE